MISPEWLRTLCPSWPRKQSYRKFFLQTPACRSNRNATAWLTSSLWCLNTSMMGLSLHKMQVFRCINQKCGMTVEKYYAILWFVFTWSPFPWSPVEITPVLTTFCGYYPCVHYFYFPWLIISQWLMTLLGMPHCGTTMGNDVARDIHCDATMDNEVAMCT